MHNNKIMLFLQSNLIDKKNNVEIIELLKKNNIKTTRSTLSRLLKKMILLNLITYELDRTKHPKRFPTKYYLTNLYLKKE
jgi:arginine repressor